RLICRPVEALAARALVLREPQRRDAAKGWRGRRRKAKLAGQEAAKRLRRQAGQPPDGSRYAALFLQPAEQAGLVNAKRFLRRRVWKATPSPLLANDYLVQALRHRMAEAHVDRHAVFANLDFGLATLSHASPFRLPAARSHRPSPGEP